MLDRSTMDRILEVSDARKRYDFTCLVDIRDGNPNGDPDNDNRPRQDEETGQGLISDVCLKRKIRDYIDLLYGTEKGFGIYVLNRGAFLEDVNADVLKECEADGDFLAGYAEPYQDGGGKSRKLKPKVIVDYFCRRYFDWRCFGAVPGKARSRPGMEMVSIKGPVQIRFGRSIDPISIQEHTITRVVQNRAASSDQESEVYGTIGAKHTIRYGLYRFDAHYSPFLARRTGFSDRDLSLFWEALLAWPQVDSSAARPSMAARRVYVFAHDRPIGNAPAHKLLEQIVIPRAGDPCTFDDYEGMIAVPCKGSLPDGVSMVSLVD